MKKQKARFCYVFYASETNYLKLRFTWQIHIGKRPRKKLTASLGRSRQFVRKQSLY